MVEVKSRVLQTICEDAARNYLMNGEGEHDLRRIISDACKEYSVMVVEAIHDIDRQSPVGTKFKSVV